MFYVDNYPLLVDDLTVIKTLKMELELKGIYRFNNIKVMPRNLQVTCPIHKEGQERKPSCGISRVKTDKVESGTVHCFTCGYKASLGEMISNCFGYNDFGAFGNKWLLQKFVTVEKESRKDLIIDFARKSQSTEKSITYITEEELESYRFYHDYMFKRKLTEEVIERFDIGYDDEFILDNRKYECLTFPVKDKTGNVLFIARRSVKGKLFHYPKESEKPVYGLYDLAEDTNEVIVCEGAIDKLTCNVYGKESVALLGTGAEHQYKELKKSNVRKFITAFDGDEAGVKATERFKKEVGESKLVTSYLIPKDKDINDLSKEEFDNLEEIF
jgi:DNA primase